MEDNFRNVLIIISVIVIGAIFIHGLWTIRKQKNPYKLKATKEKIEPVSRDFDRSGFDQDGVGQVTVKMQSSGLDVNDNLDQEPQFYNENTQPIETSEGTLPQSSMSDNLDEEPKAFSKEELGDDLVLTASTNVTSTQREPLYQQPVTNAKPARAKPPVSKVDKRITKKEQMEINFGEGSSEVINEPLSNSGAAQENVANETNNRQDSNIPGSEEVLTEQPKEKHNNLDNIEPQVIVLSVVMPANQQMFGAALLPSLLTLGLKYGEMNIFHRHQDNAGNGDVTFSLANMMKPGSFDLDSMETFATSGISLFMMLPNNGDPFVVFEQMLNAAKQLANEFNAQVLDDKRNVMTSQTEQHYMSKIREFDRQNRLALA